MTSPRLTFSPAHVAGTTALLLAALLAPSSALLAATILASFVAASVAAAFFPNWGYYLPSHSCGPPTAGRVALTFDDGPDPGTTEALLDLLERERIRATFFVVGERVVAHPSQLDQILARGHDVGNHSWSHDLWLMLRSSALLEEDIGACQRALARHGVEALAFRPPVGITNPRLPPVLRRLGLRCVTFRVRPRDFYNTRLEGLANRVLEGAQSGDFVLLHDYDPGPDTRGEWLAEVQKVIDGLRSRGLTIVPIQDLLGFPVMRRVPPSSEALSHQARAAPLAAGITARLVGVLSALLFLFYPLFAYAGLRFLGARGGALVLLLLFLLSRWRRQPPRTRELRGLAWLGVAVASLLVLAAFLDDSRFLLAYPALVNLVLLVNFAASLRTPRSMVERFARLEVEELSSEEIRYCRSVTLTWCSFFVVNGSAAAFLAAFGTREAWALYTGLFAYVFMGLLFAAEYAVRKMRFGRFGDGPLDRLLRRVARSHLS